MTRFPIAVAIALVVSFSLLSAQTTPPRKYAFPRMTSQLSALVEEALRVGPAREGLLALEAPMFHDGGVAVSIWAPGEADALAGYLRGRGIRVTNNSADTVETYVSLRQLPEVAEQPGVLRIDFIFPPQSQAVVGQGRQVHGTALFHAQELVGEGVKVGILDHFGDFRRFLGIELPTGVVARCYRSNGQFSFDPAICDQESDNHGTAVAEALVDIAPGVSLYLSNPRTPLDTHDAVQWMLNQSVRIINHSQDDCVDVGRGGLACQCIDMRQVVEAAVDPRHPSTASQTLRKLAVPTRSAASAQVDALMQGWYDHASCARPSRWTIASSDN